MNRPDDPAAQHRLAWELIPWVVNGRASDAERGAVEAHLRGCAGCREEYELQCRLHEAMQRAMPAPAPDPQPALRRLWARIEVTDGSAPAAVGARPRSRRWPELGPRLLVPALIAAVVIEGIGLAMLGAPALRPTAPAAAYRTLSASAPPPRATIRAVLAPMLTLGELQTLLQRLQLQIVEGPSEAGVYSLAPADPSATRDPATSEQALKRLRADAGVRFAEPLDPASGPPR